MFASIGIYYNVAVKTQLSDVIIDILFIVLLYFIINIKVNVLLNFY